jgi:hypothetical protein
LQRSSQAVRRVAENVELVTDFSREAHLLLCGIGALRLSRDGTGSMI